MSEEKIFYDVFISYQTQDTFIANMVCEKLELMGLKCFIAPRDILHPDWAEDIVNAIIASRAFVPVISQMSMESSEVVKELTQATRRIDYIFPFRVDGYELTARFEYHLGPYHWINAMLPPLEQRIEELGRRILKVANGETDIADAHRNRHLRDWYDYEAGIAACGNSYSIQSAVVNHNNHFVGRRQTLNTIRDILMTQGKMYLYGIGGIGKSEVVLQYIRECRDEYDKIIFIKYTGDLCRCLASDTGEGILKINGMTKEKDEDDESYFNRKIDKLHELVSKRVLLVLDNYDVDYDDNIDRIMSLDCNVIITTRNDHEEDGLETLYLEEISLEEQKELFINYFDARKAATEEDQEYLEKILELLHGHTQAIILSARMLKCKHMALKAGYKALAEGGLSSFLDTKRYGTRNELNFGTIINLFRLSNLNAEEQYVLKNMALMPLKGVSFDLFMELVGLEEGFIIDQLIRSSWLIYDGFGDGISMHPLIAEVVRHEYCLDENSCPELIKNISVRCALGRASLTYDEIRIFDEILEAMYKVNKKIFLESIELETMLIEITISAGRFTRVSELCHENIDYQLKEKGEESIELAYAYYHVQDAYAHFGKVYQDGNYWYRALEIIKKVKPNSIDQAYLCTIGVAKTTDIHKKYELLQESKQALELAQETCSPYFGSIERNKGILYYALAEWYVSQNRLEEALTSADTSISYYLACKLDKERVSVQNPLRTKAVIYSKMGKAEETKATIEEFEKWLKKDYHENHIAYLKHMVRGKVTALMNLMDYKAAMETLLDLKKRFEDNGFNETSFYDTLVEMIDNCQLLMERNQI